VAEQHYPAGSDITLITTSYDANSNVDTITETKSIGTEITATAMICWIAC
jgi:hypothetical protein